MWSVEDTMPDHEVSTENATPSQDEHEEGCQTSVQTGVCKETDAAVCLNPSSEFSILPGSGTDTGSICSLYIVPPTIDFSASVHGDVNYPKCLIK